MQEFSDKNEKMEADRASTVAALRVLTPTIIVMLGSTSALAGLEAMRHMLTLQQRDRRRVALVYIDTDNPPAPLVEFQRQHSHLYQEKSIKIAVPTGIDRVTTLGERDNHTFIGNKVPQNFANGAGGIRNNGHVAACFTHQHIYDALDRALIDITSLNLEQNTAKVQEIQAHIVAFLGGGTGSGVFIDVTVMIREILAYRQYKQRINLFCMLPEPISGVDMNDLRWRKSNATACLLEAIAYSLAPVCQPGYQKYMRHHASTITADPIANEIYLVGHASVNDASDTARIIGLDLFQRITDASSIGFLEHSKAVDRRTLGSTDDRGLPTIFSTSCPLEVRFPADETATAFARIATSHLLPVLGGYQPHIRNVGDAEKMEWKKKWGKIARVDANLNDPNAIQLRLFATTEFENVSQDELNRLWARLERQENEIATRMRAILKGTEREELAQLQGQGTSRESLINGRIEHLQQLRQEYEYVLHEMNQQKIPNVPLRPLELEGKLVNQSSWGLLRIFTGEHSGAVCDAYNDRLQKQVRAIRQQLLDKLLKGQLQRVHDAITESQSWLRNAETDERARDLASKGRGCLAWFGRLEYAHPHQRHIFDLDTLRTQSDQNVAVQRLYRWATGGERALLGEERLDFNGFIEPYMEYMSKRMLGYNQQVSSIDRHSASKLADYVIDFFREYYLKKFEDKNLFELLELAAPAPASGQSRAEQISHYLLEHLRHMRGLTSSLIAFEAELWPDGITTLDTSIYLGMHWRDSSQQGILNDALRNLGSLTNRGQKPIQNISYDPHRLQISYGQHAISLNTIRDFYLDQNSAMQYYMEYQQIWSQSNGMGQMPTHSSSEAERLVWSSDALGLGEPLVERVIRRTSVQNPHRTNGRNPQSGFSGSGSSQGSSPSIL